MSARITWLPLARSLAEAVVASRVRPKCVAISGAQGSGKTTLAQIFTEELIRTGISAITCSLDDFYLARAERVELAQAAHPLLITRGVPGTHDVDLCLRTLNGVMHGATQLPKFDKGIDDRIEASGWPTAGPVALVVIEGWCLGARPQPIEDLVAPINALERDEDADGRWRRYVNDALAGPYQTLFARFDRLIYLQAPDFDAVNRWRAEQELQLPESRRMNAAQLQRFTAHYERLTHWMLADVPDRADLTVVLDRAHRIETQITKSMP